MALNSTVNRVCISSSEKFLDPVHEVDVTAPLTLCNTFNCLFVCFYLKDVVAASTVASKLALGWSGPWCGGLRLLGSC